MYKENRVNIEQELRNAIEGEDFKRVGDHQITTRCKLSGVTIREAYNKGNALQEIMPKLNKLDATAATFYILARNNNKEVSNG